MTKKILTLILSALTLNPTAEALTHSKAEEAADFNSVVMIRAEDQDPQGDSVPAYCNATFLDPSTLVTAAHCLHGNYVLGLQEVEVSLGDYRTITRPDGRRVRVGYAVFQKETRKARYQFSYKLRQKMDRWKFKANIRPDEDLALIRLNTPMQFQKPIQFAKTLSAEEQGLVAKNPAQFQPQVVSINYFAEVSTSDTKKSATLNQFKKMGNTFKSKSNSRVEAGDSGAPVFFRIGSQWKIGAVVKGRASTLVFDWDVFCSTEKISTLR